MKHYFNIVKTITVLIAIVLSANMQSFSQDITTVTFEDVCDYSRSNIALSETSKVKRVKSTGGGKINIEYVGDMPDSLKMAIDIAADVWRDYMNTGDTLNLRVAFSEIDGADISTDVIYISNPDNGINYPKALYRKMFPDTYSQYETGLISYDAILNVNSTIDWSVGTENSDDDKKLVFAALQGIGKCLGYGTTLQYDRRKENIKFLFANGYSVFEDLVFSEDGSRLADLTNNDRQELNDFAQQETGYVYALKRDNAYKLYAPEVFDEHKSLKSSCDPSSIMYHGDLGNVDLSVDRTTLDLLSEIGWDFGMTGLVEIVCDELGTSGIGSAYESYTFTLNTSLSFSSHEWHYILPIKGGGTEDVASSTSGTSFTIPTINEEDKYERTIEGDIRGTVSFTGYTQDGTKYTAYYNVTLELRPHIISANVVSITPCSYDETYNDVVVEVYYTGSHYLHLSLESEYSPSVDAKFSNTPYYARIMFTDVDSWGYAKINIIARNDYGSDTAMIEIPSSINYATYNALSIEEILHSSDYTVEAYSINGFFLGKINNLEELNEKGEKLLILKVHSDKRNTRTLKFICR